jgi:hypothetical protein
MHPLENIWPAAAQACGRFIKAGGEALQGSVQPAFGDGQKAVAVAPEQQQQRSETPGAA